MKKLLIFISLISSQLSYAFQAPIDINIGEISGIVIDSDYNEPIPFATIIINDLEGNLVSGNSSQDDGSFVINDIPAGEYIFIAQYIGYKTFSKNIEITQNNAKLNMGTITLESDVAMLDDINIVAERSTIEQKIDRKVINIGKDLTTTGASASDIMGNLPTLNVDQDGNISMRGNDNVRILIDGKPTNIPASQLLKQIPSSSIKSIELITNPSAKYNPEGMSGIINIILHKNTNLGFNGNLNTGVTFGENTRGNASVDMNYRTGKFNFFGNVGTNLGKRQDTGIITNLTNNSREELFFLNDNTSVLYKVGMDYFLDDKNTFSIYTTQNVFNGFAIGNANLIFPTLPSQNIFQDFEFDNENISSNYNFDYKRTFDTEEHSIELEVDYNVISRLGDAAFFFSGTDLFQDYTEDRDDDITNTTINLDYINPLNENTKLELGAEARLRNSNNNYQSTNPNLIDSNYNYDNSIYSFYSTYGQTFDKWSYQLGARLETYFVDAILNGVKVFEDDYVTVYPTAYFSYALSEMKSLQISFGRRVDRPSLGQVNPVREFSTPRLTQQGNPALDPQFTNSVEFNYTHNFEKGNLTAGTFYRIINNEINQTLLEDPEDPSKILLTFVNGEDNTAYGFELSGSYKPFKWWSINPSFELYNSTARGVVSGQFREVDNTAYNLRINNSFPVTDKLTFQLFGFYRSPANLLQFDAEEIYFINTGARYSLFNDKATLSLNFNDIFNTQEVIFISELPFAQTGRFKPETRTVFLGFSYRFGGGKNGALKRKNRDDNELQGGGIF